MAHSHRLRRGRFSEPGRIYLINCVSWRRKNRFTTWPEGRCVVCAMKGVSSSATTLSYVVMPDHLHWLLQLVGDVELSALVQKMKSLSSKCLRARGVEGRIWQRGFHDHALRREEDLLATARYIVANPLRAGLVGSLKEYPLWDAVWL